MSNLLGGCCCDVIPEPDCATGECGLASSYTLSLAALYTYQGMAGAFPYVQDDCGAGGSVAVSFENMVLTAASGNCACFGEAVPPITGPERYRAVAYQVTTSPATTLAVTSSASGCTLPCASYSGSGVPGAWAGRWCGTVGSLVCVNEVNQNTGLDVWFWALSMTFASTATTACGSAAVPTWRATVGLTSEMQTACHAPTGLTWSGRNTSGLPASPRWHDGERRGLEISHHVSGSTGCGCLYGDSIVNTNATESALSVGIA